jgi:lysophospholipase L1-like esterase
MAGTILASKNYDPNRHDSILYQLALAQNAQAIDTPRKLVFLGDSITQRGESVNTTFTQRTSVGYTTWVNVLTNQRFYSPPAYNLGVNGYTVANVISNTLKPALALTPDVVVIEIGTNDITGAGNPYSTIVAGLATIYNALLAQGITVIAIPITGRSTPNTLTSTGLLKGNAVNQFIRSFAILNKNFYVADAGVNYDDPTNALWQARSGYDVDGLHSSNVGAPTIAKNIVSILNTMYPDDYSFGANNAADLYDATNNPTGNLCANGMMQGTAGTGGTGGSVATGWAMNQTVLGGATVATSIGAFSDGRLSQHLVISGTYTGNSKEFLFVNTLTPSQFSIGDVIDAQALIALSGLASPSNILDISLSLQSTENGTTYFNQGMVGATNSTAAAWSGVVKVPPRIITAVPSSIFIIVQGTFVTPQASTPALGGTVDFGAVSVRKNLSHP